MTRHFECGMLSILHIRCEGKIWMLVYVCVCALFMFKACLYFLYVHSHTHRDPQLYKKWVFELAIFFVPRFRYGTEVVHSCVLGVAFHSATQVEPWSKKSQREETTSTKQTSVLLHSRCCQFSHSFFFAVCCFFYASLLWTFALISR